MTVTHTSRAAVVVSSVTVALLAMAPNVAAAQTLQGSAAFPLTPPGPAPLVLTAAGFAGMVLALRRRKHDVARAQARDGRYRPATRR